MNAWDRQNSLGTAQVSAVDQGLRSYMLKIYNFMASALLLTGLVAYFVADASIATTETGQLALTSLGQTLFLSPLKWLVMLAPLGFAIAIGAGANRMKASTLQACFWAFAVVMGLSMASIFIVYEVESLARVFFITAATFGGMSIYGYSTKRDLTGIGNFLIMGVWGLLVAGLVNLFLQSTALSFITSAVGVLIFTGLIAYDTQKLKEIYYQVGAYGDGLQRAAILGALNLYLDFINLFVSLMRLIGDRR